MSDLDKGGHLDKGLIFTELSNWLDRQNHMKWSPTSSSYANSLRYRKPYQGLAIEEGHNLGSAAWGADPNEPSCCWGALEESTRDKNWLQLPKLGFMELLPFWERNVFIRQAYDMLDSLQEIALHEKKNEGKPLLTIVCGPTKGKSTYALYTLARWCQKGRNVLLQGGGGGWLLFEKGIKMRNPPSDEVTKLLAGESGPVYCICDGLPWQWNAYTWRGVPQTLSIVFDADSCGARLRDAAVVRRMPAWGIEDLIEIITNMHPEVDPALMTSGVARELFGVSGEALTHCILASGGEWIIRDLPPSTEASEAAMKAYNEARHITKHTSTVLNSAFPADKLEYTGAQELGYGPLPRWSFATAASLATMPAHSFYGTRREGGRCAVDAMISFADTVYLLLICHDAEPVIPPSFLEVLAYLPPSKKNVILTWLTPRGVRMTLRALPDPVKAAAKDLLNSAVMRSSSPVDPVIEERLQLVQERLELCREQKMIEMGTLWDSGVETPEGGWAPYTPEKWRMDEPITSPRPKRERKRGQATVATYGPLALHPRSPPVSSSKANILRLLARTHLGTPTTGGFSAMSAHHRSFAFRAAF